MLFRSSRLLTALCAIICCAPAFAWSYRGHRVVAYIAYERLTPQTRARVDELIRKHSDYETILTKGAPTDPAGRARYAFLTAAAWPDMIRNDPRTYDETRADASPPLYPTSILDPRRHPTWHYYDIPLSGDGTPGKFSPPPNALTELDRLIPEMAATKDDALAAYDLLWVEHLVGDVHQPLHAVSRYLD